MKEELIIFSDVHLEQQHPLLQNFVAKAVKKRIQSIYKKGAQPIIVCAGDLHNQDKGIPFLNQFKCPSIYLCGNHEFWGGDYLGTKRLIKDAASKTNGKITFLDNDIHITKDFIFVGSTLWTNLGQTINPDIFPHLFNKMNDSVYISYPEWYQKKENVALLKHFIDDYHVDKYIKDTAWNCLAELEENTKSLQFIFLFNHAYKTICKLYDKLGYENLISFNIQDTIEKLDQNRVFEKGMPVSSQNTLNDFVMDPTLFKESYRAIYNKLLSSINKEDGIANKKVIFMSHHLPFLEETLIGSSQDNSRMDDIKPTLSRPSIPAIYLTNKGDDDYPFKYFWRCMKGEYQREDDITRIAHYANDGLNIFPKDFLNICYAFVHGHDHDIKHSNFLLGRKVFANPIKYDLVIMRVLDITNQEDSFKNYCKSFDKDYQMSQNGKELLLSINEHYLNYHKISDVNKELNIIQDDLLLHHDTSLSLKQLGDIAQLWVYKNIDWNTYKDLYQFSSTLSKDIFDHILSNYSETAEFIIDNDTPLKTMLMAFDKSLYDLRTFERHIHEQLHILTDDSYSVSKICKPVDLLADYQKNISNYYTLDLLNHYPAIEFQTMDIVQSSFLSSFLLQKSFSNHYKLSANIKRIKEVEEFMKNIPKGHFNHFTQEHYLQYIKLKAKHKRRINIFEKQAIDKKYYEKTKNFWNRNKKALDF